MTWRPERLALVRPLPPSTTDAGNGRIRPRRRHRGLKSTPMLLLLPLLLLLLLLRAPPLVSARQLAGPGGQADEVTVEAGFAPLRKFLPPATPPPASAANSRASWPPFRSAPSITFGTVDGGQWTFKPGNGTETVLFVLVPSSGSHRFLPSFTWAEPQTGMSPWSGRPDLHIVFVPEEDAADARRVASEAAGVFTEADDREFWAPRLHFAADTVKELRKARSWFAEYVDAWTQPKSTVGAIWGPIPIWDPNDGGAGGPPFPRDAADPNARYLSLIDATPPVSGLKGAAIGSIGACPLDFTNSPNTPAICGALAYFGSACPTVNDVPPKPQQDVEGKVALIGRGGCAFADKIKAARASGAIAAIIYSNEQARSPWLSTEANSDDGKDFPALLIDKAPGQLLKSLLSTASAASTNAIPVDVALFERAAAPWAFASDPSGRLRRLVRGAPSLGAMVLEATSFEYEALAEASNPPAPDLGLNPTTLAVQVLENAPAGSTAEATVEIPGYITERPNSGLHLKLHLLCPERDEEKCPPTAQYVKVFACEAHVADPGQRTAGNITTAGGNTRRALAAPADGVGGASVTVQAPDLNGPLDGKPAVPAIEPRHIDQGELPMGGATRVWEGCAGEAVELGRLVSPAGREMLTVMDASPLLAALPLKADLSSTASSNKNARIKVFVKGSEGYAASLSLLFTAANPGDLVPYQTFRVSSLDGNGRVKAAVDRFPPHMIPLPRGVPSYSIVAAITAVPDGGVGLAHMFRIDGEAVWTVPLMAASQPFGCSNLTLTRSGVVPNQVDDWYGTQPGYCKGAPVAFKSFSMSRPQDADAGNIIVTYVVDDFGNGELDGKGRRANPPPGQPGHVDLEAYCVTYAFLPESPVVTNVEYRNTSLRGSDIGVDATTSATTRVTASMLALRMPGPMERDTQDAVLRFPVPKTDPAVARMPVDLYRVVVTERVLGESMVFSFPITNVEAPPNAAAVQVLNITNPPLGASPTPPHHNLRLLQDSTMPVPFPAAPAGAGTGNGMGRHLQDPNNPWAMPPVISVPPPADAAGQDSGQGSMGPVVKDMELVLKNLRPHTDYLVKLSAVSAAGPSRAALASINIPGPNSHPNTRIRAPSSSGVGGNGDRNGDKSLSAAAKAGMAVGLLATLAVLAVLGVHVWRNTSPSRFWELDQGGNNGGEGLERPSAADAAAALAALEGVGVGRGGSRQERGRRTHTRGMASAPDLRGGVAGGGDGDGEGERGEEQEICIDDDDEDGERRGKPRVQQQGGGRQEQRQRDAGVDAAADAAEGNGVRRGRSASLPASRSSFSHNSTAQQQHENGDARSHSGNQDCGNSDPESGGAFFEMV